MKKNGYINIDETFVNKITHVFNYHRTIEGNRFISSRSNVFLRYIIFGLAIWFFSTMTEIFTSGINHISAGGKFMFFCDSVVASIGAISTLFYVNLRKEIIEKIRHYIFGIITIPGFIVALVMHYSIKWLGSDTFGSTIAIAMPILFLATVVLPVFIFVKEIAGMRTLYRSKLDDQEQVILWTRNDGLQR